MQEEGLALSAGEPACHSARKVRPPRLQHYSCTVSLRDPRARPTSYCVLREPEEELSRGGVGIFGRDFCPRDDEDYGVWTRWNTGWVGESRVKRMRQLPLSAGEGIEKWSLDNCQEKDDEEGEDDGGRPGRGGWRRGKRCTRCTHVSAVNEIYPPRPVTTYRSNEGDCPAHPERFSGASSLKRTHGVNDTDGPYVHERP
ncbi:hypothetical protein KM043_010885 [Ampulex compressa]|nr:hypothetical protein KM043_010885 [Ampulex compressa]